MSKSNIKTVYVNSNIYSEKIQKENFTKDSAGSQIPDPIRYYSANFWTLEKNSLQKANVDPLFAIKSIDKETISLTVDKTKFYEDTFENGILVKKFNKTSWQNFVEQITPPENQIFEDYYTIFSEPVNLAENPDSIEKGSSFINREFVFNFFSPKYEALVGDQIFDTSLLPTVYNVMRNKQVDVRTEEENLILSLGGFIPSNYVDSLTTSNKTNELLKGYFDTYADTFALPEVAPVKKRIKQTNSIINLDESSLKLVKNLNNKYVPFPFYMEAAFTNLSSEKSDFIHVLDRFQGTKENLLQYIQNQFTTKTKNFIYNGQNSKPEEVVLQELDIKTWIDSNLIKPEGTDSPVTSGISVSYTGLLQYIRDNIKIKNRFYSNFMNDSAYYEILFYKIEKRQFNFNKQNKPINTYFITPDVGDIIKFIDTQIKYGTEYYYTITAYTMVVGTEYKYSAYYTDADSLQKSRDISVGEYKLRVDSKPTYKILEIPFAKFVGSVYEPPYTKPVVKIQQQNDSLSFELLSSDIQNFEIFEVVENSDFKLFESIRLSQDNENPETILSRINNTANTRLQIYKITKYPNSYLSFQNKLYKTLVLDTNTKSFTDTITDNMKYYYMFRYVNEHGTPSNVSQVFEVKLINEDGYYYLESKPIDIKMPFPKRETKGMKKYLLIRPSIIQTQPRFDKDVTTVDDISLGPTAQSAWEKPFVLKLTSNKTNRVLKFTFQARIDKKKE